MKQPKVAGPRGLPREIVEEAKRLIWFGGKSIDEAQKELEKKDRQNSPSIDTLKRWLHEWKQELWTVRGLKEWEIKNDKALTLLDFYDWASPEYPEGVNTFSDIFSACLRKGLCWQESFLNAYPSIYPEATEICKDAIRYSAWNGFDNWWALLEKLTTKKNRRPRWRRKYLRNILWDLGDVVGPESALKINESFFKLHEKTSAAHKKTADPLPF